MGTWGIMERQSDHGLDLLDTIVAGHLKKVDFAAFNVSETVKFLNQNTQTEIERYSQQQYPLEPDDIYMETLTHRFTHAAILIAECLTDYYQTGELAVWDYFGDYDPVEYHIRDFIITSTDLHPLLEVLQSVQDPAHWLYQSWCGEDHQRWLKHIQSVHQTLTEHVRI